MRCSGTVEAFCFQQKDYIDNTSNFCGKERLTCFFPVSTGYKIDSHPINLTL